MQVITPILVVIVFLHAMGADVLSVFGMSNDQNESIPEKPLFSV